MLNTIEKLRTELFCVNHEISTDWRMLSPEGRAFLLSERERLMAAIAVAEEKEKDK